MIQRGTLIAGLIVIELAIVGGAVSALQKDQPAFWPGSLFGAGTFAGPHLIEGGPHETFLVGARPALTVDIGYADLTIVTRNAPQIDVAVSKSTDFGPLRATASFTARKDGETIRIATAGGSKWSMGDNRMVTVVVPPQTQVTVVHAGIITANGLRAEASFNSAGRGSITVEDYNAPALHASSSGRISLHDIVTTRLDVTDHNSQVEGTGLQVRYGNVETHNGPVTLGFAASADTLVVVTSHNGTIHAAGLGPAAAVTSGHKNSDDDDDDDDSSSRTFRIGGGNGHLDVQSHNGDVELIQETLTRS